MTHVSVIAKPLLQPDCTVLEFQSKLTIVHIHVISIGLVRMLGGKRTIDVVLLQFLPLLESLKYFVCIQIVDKINSCQNFDPKPAGTCTFHEGPYGYKHVLWSHCTRVDQAVVNLKHTTTKAMQKSSSANLRGLPYCICMESVHFCVGFMMSTLSKFKEKHGIGPFIIELYCSAVAIKELFLLYVTSIV